MTDMHQLKSDSESLNSSDIQGAEASVETLEGSLANLSLDKTTSSSNGCTKESSDSAIAPSEKPCNGTISVHPQESTESTKEPKVEKDTGSIENTSSAPAPTPTPEKEEELSPKDQALKKLGLKATHRPGFYLYEDNPQRLRIQTSTHAFDLDRRCPHAKADMLKWGVLRQNNTLVCGVHYWRFNLEDEGKCIAHPEETLNACPVDRCIDW
ncbi:hypothetical protein DFQ26_004610 [Actinomortierella ambigua]|nr:hypothetical protein DFQ26_004610 [Actinomortierella ambigua]